MSTVAVVTTLSKLYVSVLLSELQRTNGAITLLALSDAAFADLKRLGLSPIKLGYDMPIDWPARDRRFAELAMPGPLTFPFPDTTLPVWKVLSIDRLSFSYDHERAPKLLELITAFRADKYLVSLDLHSSIPWAVGELGLPTDAIQCDTVRTREMLDLAPHLPWSTAHVRSEADGAFLSRSGYPREIIVSPDDPPETSTTDKDARAQLRLGLNLPEYRETVFVVYDSQTEWAFRRWCSKQSGVRHTIIYPLDPVSRRVLYATAETELVRLEAMVTDDPNLWKAADEVVMFRYLEPWANLSGVPVSVQDVRGRFLAAELMGTPSQSGAEA